MAIIRVKLANMLLPTKKAVEKKKIFLYVLY